MRKPATQLLVLPLVLALALVLSACGSKSNSSSSSGGGGKEGGTINISQSGFPDYLDPAISVTVTGNEPMNVVYTPLVTYARAEGAAGTKIVPGMAQSVPTPTNGGKTYVFKLRPNLHYSDGTAVKASDFEHALKKALGGGGKNVLSGFSSFFEAIKGAKAYEGGKNSNAPIAGVKTDDKAGTITINLDQPRGDFLYVMALNTVSLTPAAKSPFKNLTPNPPPGDGPYVIKNVKPGQSYDLVKNPKYDLPLPKGHVDVIHTKTIQSVQQQTQQVLSNALDYMEDPPDTQLLPQVRSQASDRFKPQPTISTYYLFLDVKQPPFNKLAARQAVNYAIDKTAIARFYGGLFKIGCSFLPEGMIGHPTTPCPYGDPNQPPSPANIAKAKQLVKQSGTAGMSVKVWTDDNHPLDKIGTYYTDVLNQIGYKAKVQIIKKDVYFTTIGSAKTAPQTGVTDWFQDYPHPADFFQLLNGKSIAPTNNSNYSNANDPKLNAGIEKLNAAPDLQAVAGDWAKLDNYAVNDQAFIAPFGQRQLASFTSNRLDFSKVQFHPVFQNDYLSFQLK
ncbi:MAG: peptide/nickel transport system substrate-binding protein [Solirubrobacteraceae bacterium]|nr:peptide/nickel transport system substrate-binding protein [Solirubrobacteraceae bacterium]